MSSPVYAVSDVHGHVRTLRERLRAERLVDRRGRWAGRDVTLWFLGDFFDRGPDGVGVLELVRRLVEQSTDGPGRVRALLGNHEVLALGMRQFGSTQVPHAGTVPRSFERSWTLNGGQPKDQQRLREDHVEWLTSLPVMAVQDEWLMVHSDTTEYTRWGTTVEEVNAGVRADLASGDVTRVWEVWRHLTSRYSFRGDQGPSTARRFLDQFGGCRVVHGHSVVAHWMGVDHEEVTEPLLYADGLALGIDGGLNDGGPCLLTRLAPVG